MVNAIAVGANELERLVWHNALLEKCQSLCLCVATAGLLFGLR